jgi:hypothetical protein
LSIKPVRPAGIAPRFGFAPGRLKNKVSDTIVPYPVEAAEWDGTKFVEKRWDEEKQDFVPPEAGRQISLRGLPLRNNKKKFGLWGRFSVSTGKNIIEYQRKRIRDNTKAILPVLTAYYAFTGKDAA